MNLKDIFGILPESQCTQAQDWLLGASPSQEPQTAATQWCRQPADQPGGDPPNQGLFLFM